MTATLKIRGQLKMQGIVSFKESNSLWVFPEPTSTVNLNGFIAKTTESVNYSINWGDGDSQVIASGTPTNHTY